MAGDRKTSRDLPTLTVGSVSGVPTVSGPADGPTIATLRFRTGVADETLPTHGINHIVEHLTLSTVDRTRVQFNGWVGQTSTTFAAWGERADVKAFIASVCAALSDLPLARLADEVRVLKTEAMERGGSVVEDMLRQRFGAQSYGLPWFREFALEGIAADAVRAHAARWFTRDNAVFTVTGSPRGWSLDLPAGERQPVPAAVPITRQSGWVQRSPGPFLAATWLAERSPAAAVHAWLVERRVNERMRHDAAVAYSVRLGAERVGGVVHWSLVVPVLAEHAAAATTAFGEVLRELGAVPFTTAEVRGHLKLTLQSMAAAESAAGWIERAAEELLRNDEVNQPADIIAETAAVKADDVNAQNDAFAESLLLSIPEHTTLDGFRFVPAPQGPSVTGRRFRTLAGWTNWRTAPVVTIGDAGVAFAKDNTSASVAWGDVAALLRFADGRRSIVGTDLTSIALRPRGWARPRALMRTLDARVDPSRVVELTDDDPSAPKQEDFRGQVHALSTPLLTAAAIVFPLMAVLFFAVTITAPNVALPVMGVGLAYLSRLCFSELRTRRTARRQGKSA
jgi:hypothetical protein